MWVGAAMITMFCFGTNNMIFKWCTVKGLSKIHIQLCFYVIAFVLSLSIGFYAGMESLNLKTIVLGTLIGILNANGNIQMSKAFEKGPASITTSLISMNTMIPIFCAAMIFHEQITLIQWIGIVIMFCSAIMIQYSPANHINAEYIPWLLRIGFAILSLGALGVLMKTSTYLHIDSMNTLIAMYGGGAVYLAFNSLMVKEHWQSSEAKIGSVVGIISIIGYSFYFMALEYGVSSIVFPIVSLSCLVVVFGSLLLFHEKLKMYQLIGVISAIIGIVCSKI